jgi:hypothetical protein
MPCVALALRFSVRRYLAWSDVDSSIAVDKPFTIQSSR